MSLSHFAKALGRRGGLKRAESLSEGRKKEIASSGGKARLESHRTARRIEQNFRYLEAMREIAPSPKVRSFPAMRSKLPGTHG